MDGMEAAAGPGGPAAASAPAAQRSRRGFAAMDPEKQREIARKGGRASGGRPENLRGVDRRAAGRKGGQAVVEKYGASHMAAIGRKGGRSSGGFARMDPERQREIARKGGRAAGMAPQAAPGLHHAAGIGVQDEAARAPADRNDESEAGAAQGTP